MGGGGSEKRVRRGGGEVHRDCRRRLRMCDGGRSSMGRMGVRVVSLDRGYGRRVVDVVGTRDGRGGRSARRGTGEGRSLEGVVEVHVESTCDGRCRPYRQRRAHSIPSRYNSRQRSSRANGTSPRVRLIRSSSSSIVAYETWRARRERRVDRTERRSVGDESRQPKSCQSLGSRRRELMEMRLGRWRSGTGRRKSSSRLRLLELLLRLLLMEEGGWDVLGGDSLVEGKEGRVGGRWSGQLSRRKRANVAHFHPLLDRRKGSRWVRYCNGWVQSMRR